ncbi:regulator of G-protein signaling 8-like isoform 2 [Camelus ferus]|nr:regulator of G-protein signaling 8-like isoform 2 [Camelus ferus]
MASGRRKQELLTHRQQRKPTQQLVLAHPWLVTLARDKKMFVGMGDGVAAFRAFLKTEFSEENLEFWLACEEFKKTRSTAKLVSKAHRIFEEFVDVQAPREVNIDFQTREATRKNMQEPSLTCFDQAQGKVHSLMEKDSYPRFLRSKMYLDLLSQNQRRLS